MDADILQGVFQSPGPTPLPWHSWEGEVPTLALQNINYHVTYRTGPWWTGACFRHKHVKHVLNDVNMAFPSGKLIALLGSSGSGKTSLLDVITHRTEGKVTGLMTYRGTRCTSEMMQQRVSYVIQADRLLPNLTVRETLTYTAYLKLPGYAKRRRVEDTVDNVINRMGLKAVADARVRGAVVRGISGGEKRRVTIALQLLKDPDILLLDEPTTGLDSFTARHLVASLQQLARQGRLVILSIHQPRSDIAKLLDLTALMCQGQVMYYGPTTQLVPYFTQLGYPCPTYANPLDTYVDVVSIDRRNSHRQMVTSQRMQELHDAYMTSDLLSNTKAKVAEEVHSESHIINSSRRTISLGWFRVFSTVIRATGMYPDGERFAMHVAVTFFLHLGGELLTVATLGVFQNPQLANTTTTLLLTASGLVASGFLRTVNNMIDILQYLSWVSIHKYSSEIVVANEFHNLSLNCDQQLQGLPCVPSGDVFLTANYPDAIDHVNRNFELLATFTVGFLLLAMLTFRIFGLRILQ